MSYSQLINVEMWSLLSLTATPCQFHRTNNCDNLWMVKIWAASIFGLMSKYFCWYKYGAGWFYLKQGRNAFKGFAFWLILPYGLQLPVDGTVACQEKTLSSYHMSKAPTFCLAQRCQRVISRINHFPSLVKGVFSANIQVRSGEVISGLDS